jgi:hypothetical protein
MTSASRFLAEHEAAHIAGSSEELHVFLLSQFVDRPSRIACSCGWCGPWAYEINAALESYLTHIAELAPAAPAESDL